jgi:hypothetical protein
MTHPPRARVKLGRMKIPHTAVAVAVGAALVLALAACGSGSSTTTVTTSSGASATLSTRSWNNLQAVEAKAHTENNKAVSQFGYCTTLIGQNSSKSLIDSCFQSATANVLLLGGEVTGFLSALMQETTGACHDALSQVNDEVTSYVTAVQTLDTAAKAGKVPSTDDINTAKDALGTLQASKGSVKAACFPS